MRIQASGIARKIGTPTAFMDSPTIRQKKTMRNQMSVQNQTKAKMMKNLKKKLKNQLKSYVQG